METSLTMTLYDALNVEQDASFDVIKESYHKLALKYHPDRNKKINKNENEELKSNNDNNANNELFMQIQSAWEILRDHNKRKIYDNKLKQERYKNTVSISYQVTLSECDLIETAKDDKNNIIKNIYEYPCRCGDYFEIEIDASSIQKILISCCPTCCLNLKLIL